jgi:transcriptional regulator with XRE-family HTH domain
MPSKIGPKKPFQHFIAEHRAKAKLTQKELAARLETTEMTISRWENYETRVDMPILAAIAEALPGNLEAEDLLHHPDQPTPNQIMRALPADDRVHFLKQMKNALKAS